MKTDKFLTLVKASGNIPTSQSTFTDEDILSFADEEIKSFIVPMMMKAREEYLVADVDTAIVADQQAYRLPKGTIGGKFRELSFVDSNGALHDLTKIELENLAHLDAAASGSAPTAFWLKGNKVYLYPTPSQSNGYLRFTIFKRPASLIEVTNACQINAIDTGTNTLTVDSITNADIVTTAEVDLIMDEEPNDLLSEGATISSISGTDIVLSSLPSELAVGDWLALTGFSPIIQLPEELSALLVARTVLRIFESQGYQEGIANQTKRIKELTESALQLLSPRVEGEPQRIVSPNNIRRWF